MTSAERIDIISDFARMDTSIAEYSRANGVQMSFSPLTGDMSKLQTVVELWRQAEGTLVILNGSERFLYRLCAIRYLCPWRRFRLISADLILRAPGNRRRRMLCSLKGLLLRKADRFILYHRDVGGYQKYFGIPPEKCSYVPFKVNRMERILEMNGAVNDGERDEGDYVMVAGRSMRDIDTFIEAMAATGSIPGLVLRQDEAVLASHGTPVEYGSLPENIAEHVDHGSDESFLQHMRKARVVVIPRFCRDINATGISVSLQAMALGKCVIISSGPGSSDLPTGEEAILVEPENADALAKAIQKAWHDDEYRKGIARRGYEYAMSLGGEERLLADILAASLG